jgi:hypothetical protein
MISPSLKPLWQVSFSSLASLLPACSWSLTSVTDGTIFGTNCIGDAPFLAADGHAEGDVSPVVGVIDLIPGKGGYLSSTVVGVFTVSLGGSSLAVCFVLQIIHD